MNIRIHAIFEFMLRTRFAPSPTGLLHIGNAYSALKCQQWAEKNHAALLLRIEDIDHTRCRPEYRQAIPEDLQWLGIHWHGEVTRQSERIEKYRQALEQLKDMGIVYPCFCTRRSIQMEIASIGIAPHLDEYADTYPGTCRSIDPPRSKQRIINENHSWRINVGKAFRLLSNPIAWRDGSGRSHPVTAASIGDIIIGRKDIAFSYHLAVVVDDAEQEITHVIRGEDLIHVTPLHRLLQALLGLPDPVYIHHPLLADSQGRRLTKRNRAIPLKQLIKLGIHPESLRHYLLTTIPPVCPWNEENTDLILKHLC
ncbi:MAG: tRNA glutamyl-Q(34) synthetase GluQRS [Mariprofundaceae bacterium]